METFEATVLAALELTKAARTMAGDLELGDRIVYPEHVTTGDAWEYRSGTVTAIVRQAPRTWPEVTITVDNGDTWGCSAHNLGQYLVESFGHCDGCGRAYVSVSDICCEATMERNAIGEVIQPA